MAQPSELPAVVSVEVFERFTEPARQVVVLAWDEARVLGHHYAGTEHLLLGLLREEKGLAAQVLEFLHVPIEEARLRVAQIVPPTGEAVTASTGQLPFSPRAKKVLELALGEEQSFGHGYIGTGHILLGLAAEGDGVGARVLRDFGADAETVRNAVLSRLTDSPRPERN